MPNPGLLMSILVIIFVKGSSSTEEKEVLQKMNIMELNRVRIHFILTGRPQVLNSRPSALKVDGIPTAAPHKPPHYEFICGSQACDETSKMKYLEILVVMYAIVSSAFSP